MKLYSTCNKYSAVKGVKKNPQQLPVEIFIHRLGCGCCMTAVLLLITGSAVSTESMEYFSFLWSDDVIPVYLSLCYLPLMQLLCLCGSS